MAQFVMPQLGADMTAGKLIAWRKNVGDTIERGDILADIETDKADIEVESFTSGVIEQFLIQPGDSVPVGTPLAIIREADESAETKGATKAENLPEKQATTIREKTAITLPLQETVHSPARRSPTAEGRLRISPAARKLAEAISIDPSTVQGTGPGGRITREDIERAAKTSSTPSAKPDEALDKQARMRRAIATTMAKSKREIPHYYLSTTIGMKRATEWLAEANLKRPIEKRLLYGVLLIKAVALALREIPELNAYHVEGKTLLQPDIHVGVAISLKEGGLVAPALHNVDRQSLDELMSNLQDLVKRARAGTLRGTEVSDPTITVTSLGERGAETVFGIIYPPQVAIVGFGKLAERPWIMGGSVVPSPVITATLAADHRASDGHRGGLFLASLDRWLQNPEGL